jgi:hypothetical protein
VTSRTQTENSRQQVDKPNYESLTPHSEALFCWLSCAAIGAIFDAGAQNFQDAPPLSPGDAPIQAPRRRGRPPGSKNKPGHVSGWPKGKPRGPRKPEGRSPRQRDWPAGAGDMPAWLDDEPGYDTAPEHYFNGAAEEMAAESAPEQQPNGPDTRLHDKLTVGVTWKGQL